MLRRVSPGQAEERQLARKRLSQTCLFQHLEPKKLDRLAARLERVPFLPGDRLGATQGEPQDSMYVVCRGRVVRERAVAVTNARKKLVKVDESPSGMGDAGSFTVTCEANADGTATAHVRGPDVDGLLSKISASLWLADVALVSAQAHGAPPGKEHVRDWYRVASRDGRPLDAERRKVIRGAVESACRDAAAVATHFYAGVNSFGTLHVLGRQPAFATTTALTEGVAYALPASAIDDVFADRGASREVAAGLCAEIFRMSEAYEPPPLLAPPAHRVNVAAVAVAAAFEAYYRAALNALLNASVSSTSSGSLASASASTLFPNMTVQIPTRMFYINGFKLLRQALDDWTATLGTVDWRYGLIPALAPGVLMTPASSVLEACNAEYANPEALWRRATRGATFRCGREVVFGLGLNNLADYFEDRVPRDVASTKLARTSLGSVAAGVVAGYFSHVPHNLSTLKMLCPAKSYGDHWRDLVANARLNRLPKNLPPGQASALANGLALLLPAGLLIRTTQIVGSFCMLNGISHILDIRRKED
mmetsp:Transcript_987/g.2895  ORF Transcript_987/g.2895 Transcript_987/m.2895 type:complete len:536 (-) Transcript_987:30-1637(-)